MENVHKLNGGYRSYHVTGAVNESGASIVARWSNGTPLTVVLDHHSKVERGRVVSLNVLPCPQFKVGQHKDEYWGMPFANSHILCSYITRRPDGRCCHDL